MRLGFSVRVLGSPGLPAHDARRWQTPHLSVSLTYLRDILYYLHDNRIQMYRMHSGLAPQAHEPGAAAISRQIDDCSRELAAVGKLATGWGIRLSFHPYSSVVLNALNEDQVAQSVARLEAQVAMLEAMDLGPEAVIVVHVGGVYDDLASSSERFIRRYEALPEGVKRRLALENDDHRFSYAEVYAIHRRCGVPLVFDYLHHLVLNPQGVPMGEALLASLGTWPASVLPKVHFSTPRTEMRPLEGSSRVKLPTWTEHSDFVNPFEFISFLCAAEGLPAFDIMLEAKGRDLALLALRQDIRRFAPELVGQFT
jgi:UV DNA damage endonuclease